MIPRKIYLQYVGDSDEKPTDKDDIRDGDVTWNRERVFKNDIVYYRRVKSNKARFNYSTTLNKKENQTYDRRKFQRKRKRRHTANDQQGERAYELQSMAGAEPGFNRATRPHRKRNSMVR